MELEPNINSNCVSNEKMQEISENAAALHEKYNTKKMEKRKKNN